MIELSEKKLAAIRLLKDQPDLEGYFFRNLKGKDWFYALKKEGFFDVSKNLGPIPAKEKGFVTIPHWPALDYLERVSVEAKENGNEQLAAELITILRNVTYPPGGQLVDNYRTWWVFTKILGNLSANVVTLTDIEMLRAWLKNDFNISLVGHEIVDTLFPKYLNSENHEDLQKALKILEIVTETFPDESKNAYRKSISKLDKYNLQTFFKKWAAQVGRKLGLDAVNILEKRFVEVLEREKDDQYSYIWRPTIADSQENGHSASDDVEELLVMGLRDALMAYVDISDDKGASTVRRYLASDFSTLKRIALYAISQKYPMLKELFWENVGPELFETNLTYEMFHLLKDRYGEFDEGQKEKLLSIISGLTRERKDEKNAAIYDAWFRLSYLEAIKGQDSRARQLYEENLKTAGAKEPLERPDLPGGMTKVGWIKDKSPLTVQDVLSNPLGEIIKHLTEFKETGDWEKPSVQGLEDALKEAVLQDPKKFSDNLASFAGVPLNYLSVIIKAFDETWRNKKTLDWERVLQFMPTVFNQPSFWDRTDADEKPRYAKSRLSESISELITAGTQDDSKAFDDAYLPLAGKIVAQLVSHEPSTMPAEEAYKDPLHYVINSAKGKAIAALINYSLRKARLEDKQMNTLGKKSHLETWKEVEPAFESELKKAETGNYEFSTSVGEYLANLFFLSPDWVTQNFDRLFPDEIERAANWACAIRGYCYVNAVYKPVYLLLKKGGHIKRALETDFGNTRLKEKIIQNLMVAFLRKDESFEEETSGVAKLIELWNQEDVKEAIQFLANLPRQDIKEAGDRVLQFWGKCMEKIGDKESESKVVLSNLNLFVAILDQIDGDHKSWLLKSAPYVDDDRKAFYVGEHLVRLVDKSPDAVAEIVLKILERTIPDFQNEHLLSLVEKLYKANRKHQANDICNKYAEKNDYRLRDLYEKYGRS